MAAQLPLLLDYSNPRRRVLVYQPSRESCASTVLDSPDEDDADLAVAVASSPAPSGVGASVVSDVPPPGHHGEGDDRSRSPRGVGVSAVSDVLPPGRHGEGDRSRSPRHVRGATSSLAVVTSGGPIRVVSPGRLPLLPLREDPAERGVDGPMHHHGRRLPRGLRGSGGDLRGCWDDCFFLGLARLVFLARNRRRTTVVAATGQQEARKPKHFPSPKKKICPAGNKHNK